MNTVTWKCPSNIALVKYWGKKGNQLPANPSLSFTLSECHTVTSLSYEKTEQEDVLEVSFAFDGNPMPAFEPKLEAFFSKVEHLFPFLNGYRLHINTTNTFPHSSGIASSASGMGALALCLCSMEQMLGINPDGADFYRKASFAARLGSGSASRSLYGPVVEWGTSGEFPGSSDEYAISFTGIHPVFKDYCDTILIVDDGKKEVSSSAGHAMLNDHPLAQARFERAGQNLGEMKKALMTGDTGLFIRVAEEEAMMLHALMMTGNPPFLLMKPQTLAIIQEVWKVRKISGMNMAVTLDAGANVHLLYPEEEQKQVRKFIEAELLKYCYNASCIHDHTGGGPEKLA